MYKEFYGFSEKPFESTPDPRFIYFTPSYGDGLTLMIDGIKNRAGFISITGEAGTGKTTLVHCLLSRVDEKVKPVFILHPSITFEELLRKILLDLDLVVRGKSKKALLSQLNGYLTEQMAEDETLVVIIDEAQNLPEGVMEELGRFSGSSPLIAKRLQIVFVGQPEFEDKLNSPDLRPLAQRIGMKCHIRTLTEEESRGYMEHRLKLVGSGVSEAFTPNALSTILIHARGIPGVINGLCDHALLIGYGLSKRKIDAGVIHEALKNLEGPPRKAIRRRILTAAKEFRLTPFGSSSPLVRVSFIILSLICLGALILSIHGPLELRPTNAWNAQSTNNLPVETRISLMSSSPEQDPKSDKEDTLEVLDEQERFSFEPPQSIGPASASPTTKSESNILKEGIAVEKRQTLFALAQKYYGMANVTLIDLILDFNPEIPNAHLVKLNQTIKIPKITKEMLIIQSSDLTYKIHVGTFRSSGLAEVYRDEPALKEKEIEILLRKVSPQDIWYRVVVGPFGHKDECMKVIDELKDKGLLPAFGGIPMKKKVKKGSGVKLAYVQSAFQ